MDANMVRSMYGRHLRDRVGLRRYTGTNPRTVSDEVSGLRARVKGGDAPVVAGSATQKDKTVILLYADIVSSGFPVPLTTNDKIIGPDGREMAIMSPDDDTRKVGTETIAYELRVRGG